MSQEARELVEKFRKRKITAIINDDNEPENPFVYSITMREEDAKYFAILHCELMREHDRVIADALESVGIALDDEHYSNLITQIKNL